MKNSLIELLIDAADEIESALGMMEPYYSQCGGQDEGVQIIDKIRTHPNVVEYQAMLKNAIKRKEKEEILSRTCHICHKKLGSIYAMECHKNDAHSKQKTVVSA